MNILTILGLISALAVGGVTGVAWEKQQFDTDTESMRGGQGEMMQGRAERESVEALDFVSARPEISDLPVEELSSDEAEGLLFMREEEKLARDVYSTLYDKWGIKIFSNIAQSEQTHTEAIRDLLVKYDLTDPVTDDTVGVFANDDLQDLYDTLTEQGLGSIEEALIVGATIEDLDIRDLQVEIAQTDNADIALVYENLMRGSRNHLRAFMSQLTSRDGEYTPVYITQSEFDDIINSEKEKGSGEESGKDSGGHGGSEDMQGSGQGGGEGKKGGGQGQGGGRGWGR